MAKWLIFKADITYTVNVFSLVKVARKKLIITNADKVSKFAMRRKKIFLSADGKIYFFKSIL